MVTILLSPELWLGFVILLSLFSSPLEGRRWGLLILGLIWLGLAEYLFSHPWEVAGVTPWNQWFRGWVLILTWVLLWLSQRASAEEFTLIAVVGWTSALMCLSQSYLSFFLWMELQTLSLFVLVSRRTHSLLSTEAGLKYFVMGAFVSGLFLFGISLHFHLWGDLTFHPGLGELDMRPLFPSLLIGSALLFKMAAAPFHQWVPDIYEGANFSTLLVLGTLPKLAVFSVLVQLHLPPVLLWGAGFLSLGVGAIGALNQTKIKRFLAYSTIGHTGFLMLGLSLGSLVGYQWGAMYLLVYSWTLVAFVAALTSLPYHWSHLGYLAGLRLKHPWLAFIMSLLLLSMAGIPPLTGFLVKWGILSTLISQQAPLTALGAFLMATLAVVYYIRVVKIIYFQPAASWVGWLTILQGPQMTWSAAYILAFSFYMVVTCLVCPSWLLDSLHWATWCIV
uniref:NADH:ubiquinone reductase (H(+)-translocating) n=1 Tax=Lucernaria janetae TaxID=313506 RepID=G9IST9_LUCJA|nr:NADH dehydrogenase subunit 2 [Lucernaria janetae]